MLISIYSSFSSWVVVPQRAKPTSAAVLYGPLIFEGTLPSHLMATSVWSHIWKEWEQRSFASVSEEQGLAMLESAFDRYGTLMPPFVHQAGAGAKHHGGCVHNNDEMPSARNALETAGPSTSGLWPHARDERWVDGNSGAVAGLRGQ